MAEWLFDEPPNVAVFTSRRITGGIAWIQFVTHDADDGAWQFHPLEGTPMREASLVLLQEILEIDPSVGELHDLPLGWQAWRASPEAPWQRRRRPPDDR